MHSHVGICSHESVFKRKVSRVIPVFKSGDKADVSNYRPIAVQSPFGKLFGSILYNLISAQFLPWVSNSQHGFIPGRSTASNLLTFVNYTTKEVDAGKQVDVAYFDFRKAFDRVDNDVLLKKMACAGFTPRLLNLFASYFQNRMQYVQFGNCRSEPFFTRSGISQGSNLGPLEFLIFINDLPSLVPQCLVLLFADDVKLAVSIESEQDCMRLQEGIDKIYRWSIQNRLDLNVGKCAVMTFSRSRDCIKNHYTLSGSELKRVTESVRDLGVIFTADLNFRCHIKEICTKARKSLGWVLRQARVFKDPSTMALLYNAFVRSRLEFNAIIWSPAESTYTLMLEKVQRLFLRHLYKKTFGYFPYLYPSTFILGMTGFNTLELRRNVALIIYVCDLMQGKTCMPALLAEVSLYVPNRGANVRIYRIFALHSARTNLMRNRPLTRALRMLNCMARENTYLDIFHSSVAEIRRCAVRYLE